MRRGVLPVQGSRVLEVRFPDHGYRPIQVEPAAGDFSSVVTGQTLKDISRRGKRLLLALENDHVIIVEPRMTGLMLLSDPPDLEHLRVGFRLDHGDFPWLWFWDRRGLGRVLCLPGPEAARRLGPEKLGVDALEATVADLTGSLGASRRPVKVALLDQRAIAGIGNLYASEILHLAGIDPRVPCLRLKSAQWQGIHAAIGEVLREAIRHEGSTLSDGTYRNALNQQGGYQNHHRVYDRAGGPCPRCGLGVIRRIVQAQRSTFFCPACQKRRGSR